MIKSPILNAADQEINNSSVVKLFLICDGSEVISDGISTWPSPSYMNIGFISGLIGFNMPTRCVHLKYGLN